MKKTIYLSLLAIMVLASSCEKWLTIRPKDKIEKEKLYETEDGFWQALNGIYGLLYENYHVTNESWNTFYADKLAGLWVAPIASVGDKLEQHAYKDAAVDNKLGEVFLRFYKLVAHCNTILAYVDKVDFLPERTYNMIKGEALAMRAFVHLDLIRIWGPMPTNVDDGYTYLPYVKEVSKQKMTYHTFEDYMEFLENDLIEAEQLLGKVDPLMTHSNEEMNTSSLMDEYERLEFYYRQHHMNYFAVCALRARMALWKGDKETAMTYAKIVKDAKNEDGSPKFRLGTEADVLPENTETNTNTLATEHIAGFYETYFNFQQHYGSASSGKVYMETSKLGDLFQDVNDFRYKKWIGKVKDDARYSYITKYMCYNNMWIPLIRLSEMYLILAETLPLEEANQVYKEYCESRGCAFSELRESSRKNQILMEYYREFMGEGQIFYANKRMGLKKMLWIKEDMAEGQYTLPLPLRESDLFN